MMEKTTAMTDRDDAREVHTARWTGGQGFDQLFAGGPLMLILRGYAVDRARDLAGAAWDGGIGVVEVPIQSGADVETLEALVADAAVRGLSVGAGTVTSRERVATARRAGAAFTVSPGFDPDVVRASLDAGLPSLPGVATASEVQAAERMGVHWVKAFPAGVLGPTWFVAMHGPFPDMRFVATGGMDAGNAAEFLAHGADVVAVGSAVAAPDQLAALSALAGGAR